MITFEAFDAYIEQGGRDYWPYFENSPTAEVSAGNVRLFRRTGNPEIPQLAQGFREIANIGIADVVKVVNNVEVPEWYSDDPFKTIRADIGKLSEEAENLPDCRIPVADRVNALYLLKAYQTPVAWLSACQDEKIAREEIWPHLDLMELEVPLEYVMPVPEVTIDTLSRVGMQTRSRSEEIGIFGGIKAEWVINVELGLKHEEKEKAEITIG